MHIQCSTYLHLNNNNNKKDIDVVAVVVTHISYEANKFHFGLIPFVVWNQHEIPYAGKCICIHNETKYRINEEEEEEKNEFHWYDSPSIILELSKNKRKKNCEHNFCFFFYYAFVSLLLPCMDLVYRIERVPGESHIISFCLFELRANSICSQWKTEQWNWVSVMMNCTLAWNMFVYGWNWM